MADDGDPNCSRVKDPDEEWQAGLHNWLAKRRQQMSITTDEPQSQDDHIQSAQSGNSRKIKTFAEMLGDRARAGTRIKYNLDEYIGNDQTNNGSDAATIDDSPHVDNLNPERSPSPSPPPSPMPPSPPVNNGVDTGVNNGVNAGVNTGVSCSNATTVNEFEQSVSQLNLSDDNIKPDNDNDQANPSSLPDVVVVQQQQPQQELQLQEQKQQPTDTEISTKDSCDEEFRSQQRKAFREKLKAFESLTSKSPTPSPTPSRGLLRDKTVGDKTTPTTGRTITCNNNNDNNNHGSAKSSSRETNNTADNNGQNDLDKKKVISVSGRKHCASCNQELGRGRAAMVIESLSLCYHIECFRCSVCHVQLSKGFQGTDVRMHANALHCQNCFSKDGLNFSRV